MVDRVRTYFDFTGQGTNFRREVVAGRHREVQPGLWVLGFLSLFFFIFDPYT